jgi:hypothetical protein
MQLHLVHYSQNCPQLLRQLCERIELFCANYESDADRDILFEQVTKNYFDASPRMLFLVAEEDGKVVAHLVAQIEEYYGARYVSIIQYWRDKGIRIPDEMKADAFRQLIHWGKMMATDKVRIWARNEEVAQVFEKTYGFVRDKRIIMNASLSEIAALMEGQSATAAE